jgi:hypothetical protein
MELAGVIPGMITPRMPPFRGERNWVLRSRAHIGRKERQAIIPIVFARISGASSCCIAQSLPVLRVIFMFRCKVHVSSGHYARPSLILPISDSH